MEKVVSMTMVVGTLLFGILPTNAGAELCNPSFEDDGPIADIFITEPNCWDVNHPYFFSFGSVDPCWPTDGNYNLTLGAYAGGPLNPGEEMVTVSQTVYLTDVNAVIFDINLATEDEPWDPCNCGVVLLIDGDVVWELNSVGPDWRGEYFDEVYEVDPIYRGPDPVRLSLGLKAKELLWLPDKYITHWDNIRMPIGCGGAGYLAGDLNGDCWVDNNDLRILAGMWLDKVELNGYYDIHGGPSYGFVDFRDFAVYADGWDGTFLGLADISEKWLRYVDPCDTANYDEAVTGIVDVRDFAVLAADWVNVFDLVFIHHSCGYGWLEHSLHNALEPKAYIDERNDIYYGTGLSPDPDRPDSLSPTPGDLTDMNHWLLWFNDYLASVAVHGCTNGVNRIIMFKSCYPNSNITSDGTEPGDPFSSTKTITNYKAVYRHPDGPGNTYTYDSYTYKPLEDIFAENPDTLFIAVTAPPRHYAPTDATNDADAHRARTFNNWLKNDWLADYNAMNPDFNNVAVFDWFDLLAYPDDDLNHPNRLRSEYGGESGDSHPNDVAYSDSTEVFATDPDNFIDNAWNTFVLGP